MRNNISLQKTNHSNSVIKQGKDLFRTLPVAIHHYSKHTQSSFLSFKCRRLPKVFAARGKPLHLSAIFWPISSNSSIPFLVLPKKMILLNRKWMTTTQQTGFAFFANSDQIILSRPNCSND
ncbi:unnamed protein product, partial [Vitis vinifera]